ncbi:MAG: DUF420 domain-containing protein [Chlamydiae bacterium]|nr:DUF420 domain-containing protein [Chlamydiota bacterium]MBI3265593.1 DUF420 domain-containing protein [Chlamydiota bacterium]
MSFIPLSIFPKLNASLNATSACFLLAGYILIRKKKISAHRFCMLGALIVSFVFLICYLYYHAHHGVTRFQGQGWLRPCYFSILISHTVLAVLVFPMALVTVYRAFREDWSRHKRLARWTFPIWLYVSITGVIVYAMLY